ncbi:MAG TPA: FixH family protein [Polyangiaceae bacterium]|nr:FixH family protein [Polyangiaceae bacterium]
MIARLLGIAVPPAVLLALMAFWPFGCSSPPADAGRPPAFQAAPYLSLTTTSVSGGPGALAVDVRTSPQPPQRGTVAVELTVTNVADAAPRDGLTVRVVPWMPQDDHGASIAPVVTAQGDGKYLVTGIDLFMPGRWELRTTFAGPVTDQAAPAFDVP